jgi:putative membrane protein
MAGLAIAIWEYVWIMRYLWRKEFQGIAGVEAAPWHTPLLGVAFVLLFVSIFAFCAVLLRWP